MHKWVLGESDEIALTNVCICVQSWQTEELRGDDDQGDKPKLSGESEAEGRGLSDHVQAMQELLCTKLQVGEDTSGPCGSDSQKKAKTMIEMLKTKVKDQEERADLFEARVNAQEAEIKGNIDAHIKDGLYMLMC